MLGSNSVERVDSTPERVPQVSIVTIDFNNLAGLKATFASVVTQTNRDFEYIVIDGGSQDGSVEFLQQHSEHFSYCISEPDRGIYDAMNKGVAAAIGKWVIFMNSGDLFYEDETLARVVDRLADNDVVYGEWVSIFNDEYGNRTKHGKPSDLSQIWNKIPACHQSILVRRELLSEHPFDISLKWCGDHDLLAKLYQLGCKFQQIPVIVTKFDASGGTARELRSYTQERWSIYHRYFEKMLKRELYFINEYRSFWVEEWIISPIRQLLPKQWIIATRKLRGIY
jgi:glycosyltransferase involved in cell wall biosynthesis